MSKHAEKRDNQIFVPGMNATQYQFLNKRVERQEMQSLQYQRRQRMRMVHKEMLVADLVDKKVRTDSLLQERETRAREGSLKQALLQNFVVESKQHALDVVRPVQMEIHREDWQQDLKKIKKAKELGTFSVGM